MQTRESWSKTWEAGTGSGAPATAVREAPLGSPVVLLQQGHHHLDALPSNNFAFTPGTYTRKTRVSISLITYPDRQTVGFPENEASTEDSLDPTRPQGSSPGSEFTPGQPPPALSGAIKPEHIPSLL